MFGSFPDKVGSCSLRKEYDNRTTERSTLGDFGDGFPGFLADNPPSDVKKVPRIPTRNHSCTSSQITDSLTW